jgi:hypothetical protein
MSDATNTKRIRSSSFRFGLVVRRLPFTLIMVMLLLLVAWWTNSYVQELTREWVNRLGFAPRDFWFLRWWRLILSALVTSGGITFWFALGMVAFTSGVAEWKAGTLRAALTFWGVHLVTLVLEGLIFSLPMRQLGFSQERSLFFSRNVGPSAGYMGSLGLITTFLPRPWRWVAFGAILAYLLLAVFLPARAGVTLAIELSDDLAHLIAYPLGFISAYLFEIKRKS